MQYILFGMIFLFFVSCGGSKKPDDILTEKEMVNVMTELYLAEEKANAFPIPYDSMKKLFPMFSARAFAKAGVSDTVFQKSLDYYMGQPEKLENIYTVLVDSLNLKAQRAGAQKDVAPE